MVLFPKIDGLFQSHEKVESGFYACTSCESEPFVAYVSSDNKTLPKCEKCDKPVYWMKV